jgi:hemerythrin-like domain-containing protein
MEPVRQVSRMLHEEHMAALSLLERLEAALLRAGHATPPDSSDGDVVRLMGDLRAGIEGEITAHFAFEENQLFPSLAEAGNDGMINLLLEEHEIILPLGERLAKLTHDVQSGNLSGDDWAMFHRLGNEFVERLRSHIEKEEMGLIASVEADIDAEVDMRLAEQYASNR